MISNTEQIRGFSGLKFYRQSLVACFVGLLLSISACSNEPKLVAVQETGGYCLNEACMDPNGFLICFVTEAYLYDDGTQTDGKSRQITGPKACGDLPEMCWQNSDGVWKCGAFNSEGETVVP